MASFAMPATSLPYPRSKSSTIPLPVPLSLSLLKFLTCVRSCSTAPLLKLSQAAMRTLRSFCSSQKQTFDSVVDLPTPLTPMKTSL